MTPNFRKAIRQISAIFTSIVFTSTTVLAQVGAPQNLSGQLDFRSSHIELARSLDIPQEAGQISSIFIPKKSDQKPFIFHIQDIHANESAQKKILGIMDVLSRDYEVSSFGFEGANTELKPSVMHFAESPETNIKIANYMVSKGQLTGGELFALQKSETSKDPNKFHFEGIENGEQYWQDLKIFRQGLSNKESIDLIIKSLNSRIDRFKSAAFSRELARFDKHYQAYENREEKNLLSIYKEVQSKAKSVLGLDLLNVHNQFQYPQMVRMAYLISEDKSMRADQVKADINRIQKSLSDSSAAKNELNNFNQLLERLSANQISDTTPYASWRECFESLRAFMSSNHLKWTDYPNFRAFAMHLILQEEMMSAELFEELNLLIYKIEMKMAQDGNPLQVEIVELAHDVQLLQRFLSLEASRNDVDQVISRKPSLIETIKIHLAHLEQSDENSWVSPEESDLLLSQYDLAVLFYQGAHKREVAFVDHVLEMANMGNHRVAFVTGGYHTQGIREELERRGVAYATITPKLSSDETTLIKEFSEQYEQGMLGTLPNIFEKSKIVDVLKLVSTQAYEDLGDHERDRVKAFMEAIIKAGVVDLVQEIRQGDQSIDKLDEIAPALQTKLRMNELLSNDEVQVQAIDGNLRFSWKSFRSGYLLPSEGMVKLVNALNQVSTKSETVQSQIPAEKPVFSMAASLGKFKSLILKSSLILPIALTGCIAIGCGPVSNKPPQGTITVAQPTPTAPVATSTAGGQPTTPQPPVITGVIPVSTSVITVGPSGRFATAQQALNEIASQGYSDAEIIFEAGTYLENLDISGPRFVNLVKMTISGAGTDKTIIDPGVQVDGIILHPYNANGRPRPQNTELTIKNLRIQNARTGVASAFNKVNLENVELAMCEKGLYIQGDTATVKKSLIRDNQIGVYADNSFSARAELDQCTFANNINHGVFIALDNLSPLAATRRDRGKVTNSIFLNNGNGVTVQLYPTPLSATQGSYFPISHALFFRNGKDYQVPDVADVTNVITGQDPLLDQNFVPQQGSPAIGAGQGGVTIGARSLGAEALTNFNRPTDKILPDSKSPKTMGELAALMEPQKLKPSPEKLGMREQFLLRELMLGGRLTPRIVAISAFKDQFSPDQDISKLTGEALIRILIDRDVIKAHPDSVVQSTGRSLGAQQQSKVDISDLVARDKFTIEESVRASMDLTDGIFPLASRLAIRFVEFSRAMIDSIMAPIIAQILGTIPSTEAKPIVTRAERALDRLRVAGNSFASIEQGYGLQIEMIGDKVPSKADIESIIANLKLHPQLFVRLVYTGANPAGLQNVVTQIQESPDFSNRNIGIRFGIVMASPEILSIELPKIPVSVFNLINKFGSDLGLKEKPRNSVALIEHTSIIGSADVLEEADLVFSSSIKVVNDVTDVDMPVVRLASGHMAVKSFAGLEPELQASFHNNTMKASDFLSVRLEQLQSEIKAVISVLIAA